MFRPHVGAGVAHGGDDAVQRNAMPPLPCAPAIPAIAFTAYIFLPKTRDGLMIEGLWN